MRKFIVNVNGVDYNVEVREESKAEQAKVERVATPAPKPAAAPVAVAPAPAVPVLPQATKPAAAPVAAEGHSVNAPMPGKIIKVAVTVGQKICAGDVVLILEAMKMQNEIKTPVDGVVKAISVEAGQTVKPGESMAIIG